MKLVRVSFRKQRSLKCSDIILTRAQTVCSAWCPDCEKPIWVWKQWRLYQQSLRPSNREARSQVKCQSKKASSDHLATGASRPANTQMDGFWCFSMFYESINRLSKPSTYIYDIIVKSALEPYSALNLVFRWCCVLCSLCSNLRADSMKWHIMSSLTFCQITWQQLAEPPY